MLCILASVIDWRVATDTKQRQVDIDNIRENSKRVTHDYAIGNQFYVEMTGIYCKLYYKNKDRIESLKSLQKLKFDSNGDKEMKKLI